MIYTVNANHCSADYASIMRNVEFALAGVEPRDWSNYFRVSGDDTNGYYATARLLGCGKTCRTIAGAIVSLLADNGYTDISVTAPAPAPASNGKPLAKSLHTVTVLVRVARDIQSRNPALSSFGAVHAALELLGLGDMPDDYALATQAAKQLRK